MLAGTAQHPSLTHHTGGPWVLPGAGTGLEKGSGPTLPEVSCIGRSPDPSLGLLLWVPGVPLASSLWVAVGTDRPLIAPAPAQGPGWGKQEEPVTNRWQKARKLPVHKTASSPCAPPCHAGHRGLARCSLVGSPRVGTSVGRAGWQTPEWDRVDTDLWPFPPHGPALLGVCSCQTQRPGLVGQAGVKQDLQTVLRGLMPKAINVLMALLGPGLGGKA